jgi:hypothetical protein
VQFQTSRPPSLPPPPCRWQSVMRSTASFLEINLHCQSPAHLFQGLAPAPAGLFPLNCPSKAAPRSCPTDLLYPTCTVPSQASSNSNSHLQLQDKTMAAVAPSAASASLQDFLEPLRIDAEKVRRLSEAFAQTFKTLSAESATQFLGTPISDSILRSVSSQGSGRYVHAIRRR